MRTFHIPRWPIATKEPELSTPWVNGHASPEDRALGHELELIELLRQRSEVDDGTPEAAEIDREIEDVRRQLVEVAVLPDLPKVA